MFWNILTLSVIGVFFAGGLYWVYSVFLRDPDGAFALKKQLKVDAGSPSFGFWVWWAGPSRLADITLPLLRPMPLCTAVRGVTNSSNSNGTEGGVPKEKEDKKDKGIGSASKSVKEGTGALFKVVGKHAESVAEELSPEVKEAVKKASVVLGESLRLAGGGARAAFEVGDSGDEKIWRGLRALEDVRKALNASPLDDRGGGKYWDSDGSAFPREWVDTAVEAAESLRPVWESIASPGKVGLQRIAFSVQLTHSRGDKGVALNMEAPLVSGPPAGLRVYVDPVAYRKLSHEEKKRLHDDELFCKVFVAEGPKKDLLRWWADGGTRVALVKGWEMLGGGLEVSSQGVFSGVALTRRPGDQFVRRHIRAFADLVLELSHVNKR